VQGRACRTLPRRRPRREPRLGDQFIRTTRTNIVLAAVPPHHAALRIGPGAPRPDSSGPPANPAAQDTTECTATSTVRSTARLARIVPLVATTRAYAVRLHREGENVNTIPKT